MREIDKSEELDFYQGVILGCFDGYNPIVADEFQNSLRRIYGEDAIKYLSRFVKEGLIEESTKGRIFRKKVFTLTFKGFQTFLLKSLT